MIDSWQRGTWFDLWTGEQNERVRLRWISPRRNFYLFTSAETGKAHSLAPLILRGFVQRRTHQDGRERAAVRAGGRRHDARPAGRRRAARERETSTQG